MGILDNIIYIKLFLKTKYPMKMMTNIVIKITYKNTYGAI